MNKSNKHELLFSVTKHDCRWDYFRCSGPGGQHRNKTESGVRCTHKASGAVGQACDSRSKHDNKRLAFERMANSKQFKDWHRIEVSRRTGALAESERRVKEELKKIKVEVKENGKWKEVNKNAELDQ